MVQVPANNINGFEPQLRMLLHRLLEQQELLEQHFMVV